MNLEDRQKALADFDAWFLERCTVGWPNDDVKIAAVRLRGALWEAANNDPIHPTLPAHIAKLAAAFEAAKAAADT